MKAADKPNILTLERDRAICDDMRRTKNMLGFHCGPKIWATRLVPKLILFSGSDFRSIFGFAFRRGFGSNSVQSETRFSVPIWGSFFGSHFGDRTLAQGPDFGSHFGDQIWSPKLGPLKPIYIKFN